jgi:chorismate dehydratase
MALPTKQSERPATAGKQIHRIGCVGYLNAKPLIEGLEGLATPEAPVVRLDVPSALVADLERGEVDIALCPVIDYYRSKQSLVIVPVGCIASDGPTQTVRLFSQTPIESIKRVHADTDSHTSVALLRVLLDEMYRLRPEVLKFDARGGNGDGSADSPETMLLIGDKVVNDAPSAQAYPYQLDLGEAWKQLTGLPFVFAVWMAHRDTRLGDLPQVLDRQRQVNAKQIEAIADRHAVSHGWKIEQARNYLGGVLSYGVGAEHLEAIERFARYAEGLGLIENAQPLELWRADA